DRQRWTDAHALLSSGAAEPADLERLAVAAYLIGRQEESTHAWERAHLAFARIDDLDHAARCAAWLAITLVLAGDMARAHGWFARAKRLIDDAGSECAAVGYLQ